MRVKIDVHKFLIELVPAVCCKTLAQAAQKTPRQSRANYKDESGNLKTEIYSQLSSFIIHLSKNVLSFFSLLELHAHAIASRQRINLTGHRDVGHSLTGIVFEERDLLGAGAARNGVIQQLA
jgi:hypothetical protein